MNQKDESYWQKVAMMSLSKNLRKITDKVESWLSYEMESFEPYNTQEKGGKNRFFSLETGSEKKLEFIPLEALENVGNKERKAEEALKNTQEKTTNLEEEAYEKGFAQGEKDGFELGEKKAIKVLENIERLFNEINDLKYDILKRYEKEILNLIFAIAEKIIHHEVRLNETAIKDAIFNALELAVEKSKVTFNVNPEDYEYVEKLRPDLFNQFKELKSIIVTSDPSISRGGCFLETPYGNIDATIESKLENIFQLLQESVD